MTDPADRRAGAKRRLVAPSWWRLQRHVPALPIPPILASRWLWLVVATVIIVMFFVHIPTAARRHPLLSPLGDQFHVGMMAVVMLLVYWRGPLRGRLWLAVAATVVSGALVEIVQPAFGRTGQVKDFLLDLVGIGATVGLILWRGHRRQSGLVLMIVTLLSIPAQLYRVPGIVAGAYRMRQTFPLIANFETGLEHWLWDKNSNPNMVFTMVPDGPEGWPTTVLRISGGPPDRWPGIKLRRFPHDWSGFRTLAFDVRVLSSGTDTIPMGLRLEDYPGKRNELYARASFGAWDTWHTERIDLTGLAMNDKSRNLDTGDMDLILFYLPRPPRTVVYEIDNVRLMK